MYNTEVNLQSEYTHAKNMFRRAYKKARRNKSRAVDAVEYWRSVMRQYRYHLNNSRNEFDS